MPALKRSGSSFAERNDVKPADLGWTPPAAAASSSKLGLDAAEAGVKSESDKTRSPSVVRLLDRRKLGETALADETAVQDSKGKAKEEDIDWEAELAKEEALLSEELDQEEEILLTTYSANIVGCTSFAGAKKRASFPRAFPAAQRQMLTSRGLQQSRRALKSSFVG